MWQFAPNSLHYLLSLWQRMVASMPYVKNTEPHLLETYAPEVPLHEEDGTRIVIITKPSLSLLQVELM